MGQSWIESEPGWSEASDVVALAWKRVRARWLSALCLALIATALAIVWQARRPRTFPASLVVRVTESQLDTPRASRPTMVQLTSLINEVFLTRSFVLSVIEKHGLYPEKRKNPDLALEAMHDDLELHVVQNYFEPERDVGPQVRS